MAAVVAKNNPPVKAAPPQASNLRIIIKFNPNKRSSDDVEKQSVAKSKAKTSDNGGHKVRKTNENGSPSYETPQQKGSNKKNVERKQSSSKPNCNPPSAKAEPPTSVAKCNDSLREKVRQQLYGGLCKVPSEEAKACDPSSVAASVEAALFNNWGKFNGARTLRYRSVLFNIRDENNPDFRRKVLVGEIKPEAIAEMASEEMVSDRMKRQVKQIRLRALAKCQQGGVAEGTTDQFVCERCKRRKASYSLMQIRSADEPMTALITCVSCGHVWKEG